MPEPKPRHAVFLDRDGTIAEEVGYLNHLSRFQVYPFSAAAIRRLNDVGLAVVVVTNQSGVQRDFFPETLVHQIHERMVAELAAGGARLDAIYYCPHITADECDCRKPRTGMLKRAAREHRLEVRGSWVVGDRYSDMELAHAAGCRGILVLSGYGRGEYEWHHGKWKRQPDHVAENLEAAVEIILKESR
ncbi:MAG: HAD family hydrolase [Acidobacteria bacterium]|nr:HAD family hydrolase [Acidobacteriota bacterium]MCL5289327.1 HAD family hydrolase [Acidobacteriota bacterium]